MIVQVKKNLYVVGTDWTGIYRVITIIMTILIVLAGVISGVSIGSETENGGLMLACIVGGFAVAGVHLAANMLFIQLVENVQAIRRMMQSTPDSVAAAPDELPEL